VTTTTATTPGIDCPYCGPQRPGVTQCGCGYTPERDAELRMGQPETQIENTLNLIPAELAAGGRA